MKVKLLSRKGWNDAGTVQDHPDAIAEWLIGHGYADPVGDDEPEKASGEFTEEAAPAPRRGRKAQA